MRLASDACKPTNCDYWLVSQAASKLGSQASTLGARHIKDGTLRLQFNREIAYYAKIIVDDVASGKKTPEQGLIEIKNEQASLLKQGAEVGFKGAGVIAGALQVVAGAGICYGSAGTLCLVAGVPMMAHGANNIYENGRDLIDGRSGTQGPIRQVYQAVAQVAGYDEKTGDIAYGTGDLLLSTYGVVRQVLKPDSWRLFRYIETDYVRAYKNASRGALTFEAIMGGKTAYDTYGEAPK